LVRELDAISSGAVGTRETPVARRQVVLFDVLAGAVVLLALGAIYYQQSMRGSDEEGGAVKRIAVLPFVNAGGSKDDDYFADGMSDELGAALGKVRGVQVASHTSAFTFRGSDLDPREIGRKLSVDAVLEGKVRRAGSQLRVTAELTDVRNGLSLWSDSYERDSKDVFAVQDDIARSIARALEVRFSQRP